MKPFSEMYVKNLKPTDKEYFVREGKGFTLRVRKSGLKTFFFIYTLDGKRKYLHLGEYPSTSIADAREQYQLAFNKHKKGISLVEPLQPPAVVDEPVLFKDFAKLYLEATESTLCSEWWDKMRRCLDKDVLPFWSDTPITNIGRRAVILLLERVAARSSGMTANVKKAISGVFDYALLREYVEVNPCLGLTKAVPALKRVKRERALSDEEIRKVWHALTDMYSHRALKLILLTAQRPGEVAGIVKSEICGNTWTIPKERAEKGKGAHLVHLTQTALELLKLQESNERILDVQTGTVSQEVARRLMCCGLPRWTPHDLRRTARTKMAEIGIINEHAEAVLAHAKPGMVGVYNQYEYQDEKKEALIKWEAELLRIVS